MLLQIQNCSRLVSRFSDPGESSSKHLLTSDSILSWGNAGYASLAMTSRGVILDGLD